MRRANSPEGDAVEPRSNEALVEMTARIVDSYLKGNQVLVSDVPGAIQSVHAAIARLAVGNYGPTDHAPPAVPIKKSLGDDFIICLEDGKKLTMLTRYLKTKFQMSPEEYRRKWRLPPDYPMVTPAYARLRSELAKKNGLGGVPASVRRARKKV